MPKNRLRECKMSDVAYLEEAARWSKDLTRMKSRGPGDTENAMRLIEREYGIDYWQIWKLRYRFNQISDIGVTVYMKLQAAYQAECERQLRKLQNEIVRTEEITGPDSHSVRSAKALVSTHHT